MLTHWSYVFLASTHRYIIAKAAVGHKAQSRYRLHKCTQFVDLCVITVTVMCHDIKGQYCCLLNMHSKQTILEHISDIDSPWNTPLTTVRIMDNMWSIIFGRHCGLRKHIPNRYLHSLRHIHVGLQYIFSTLWRLTQQGHHFTNNIYKRIFVKGNVGISIKIQLMFVCYGSLTIRQHWLR